MYLLKRTQIKNPSPEPQIPNLIRFSFYLYLGGVNHCHLHCRLAKFRDLMRRVKYGAVIGHKMHFFVCAQYELPGYGFLFSLSQRRI
jgi:hypothetical protein